MVAIHEYDVWVEEAGAYQPAPRKATATYIASVGGRITSGTEEDVEATQLTPEGEFEPMPLGANLIDMA